MASGRVPNTSIIFFILYVIDALERADIVAVEDYLAFEFVPVLLDLVVLDHDDDHVAGIEEFVEVMALARHDVLVDKRIVAEQRLREVALLALQHLQGGGLADVVHVLLVGDAIEANPAVVGDTVLLHDLVDAVQHELGLAVVGLHRLVDHLRKTGVVADEEPGVHADAVASDAGTGLEDVDARMHVADADDLVDVHIVVAADPCELVGEGDVDSAEGVLDDFGHLGGADVRDHDLALAETGVELLDVFADGFVVGAYRAVVVQEFIDHVAGDNALRGVHEVDIAVDGGTDEFVDRARADCALNDDGRSVGADLQHLLDCSDDVAGVHLLAEFVVWSGDRDDVCVGLLILSCKLYARLDGGGEKFIQSVLFERGLAGVQGLDEFFIVVSANDFHSVGSHHQCSGQANVAEADNVYHFAIDLLL